MVAVGFADTKRGGPALIRLTVVEDDARLFITQYENVAVREREAERAQTKRAALDALADTATGNKSPEAIVRSQLDILAQAGAGITQVMNEVVEQSEPLWISSKSARASLGRLIGMYAGLAAASGLPKWSLVRDAEIVTATPTNPDELGGFSMMLKGIRFEVVQQDGWKLVSATAFR